MKSKMILMCFSVVPCCLAGVVGCDGQSLTERRAEQGSTEIVVTPPFAGPPIDAQPTVPTAGNSSAKNDDSTAKVDHPRVGKFAELDTDDDGQLTLAEFSSGRKDKEAKKWFDRRDADRDGFLSLAEFVPTSASRAGGQPTQPEQIVSVDGKPAGAPKSLIKGWGESEDPTGGTKIELQGTTLVMTTPAAYIDNFPKGAVNAPRVLQEVSGDFTSEVKVMHVDPALAGSVLKSLGGFPTAYHAGALFVHADDKNLIRFERVSKNTQGMLSTTCELQVWESGKLTAQVSEKIADTVLQLRLERRGDRLLSSFSQDDGKTWKELPRHELNTLRGTVKVGVSITNNTDPGCTVKFQDLKVVKGSLP